MRHNSEVLLIVAVSAFALTGAVALALYEAANVAPTFIDPVVVQTVQPVQVGNDVGAWFQSVRQYCNPVEVETRMRWQPAPGSPEGTMHEAACFALAGRIDHARTLIQRLPSERQYQAAGVVFEAGHPAADAGDDLAAGPLMELVVEFWPNHYMALYHAGAASYERGEHEKAQGYLERFLVEYAAEDGWRSNAQKMLETIG